MSARTRTRARAHMPRIHGMDGFSEDEAASYVVATWARDTCVHKRCVPTRYGTYLGLTIMRLVANGMDTHTCRRDNV